MAIGSPGDTLVTSTAHLGPKPWHQCGESEKIDRLRDELDGWRRACADLRDRVDLLEAHQHDAEGKVLVDLKQAQNIHRMQSSCGSINTLR